MEQFNALAKAKRIKAGLSQQKVCDALGLSHRADVHKRETGKVEWKLNELFLLCNLLGINPSELLSEIE